MPQGLACLQNQVALSWHVYVAISVNHFSRSIITWIKCLDLHSLGPEFQQDLTPIHTVVVHAPDRQSIEFAAYRRR